MVVVLQEWLITESDIIYGIVIGSQVRNLYEADMNRQPIRTPGLHFHTVPYLATVQRIIVGMDAETPNPMEWARARGLEHPLDECNGMSAAEVQLGSDGEIAKLVVRALGTAKEREAMTLMVYVQAASGKTGKVVYVIPDLQSSTALEAYYCNPQTHEKMSHIISRVMKGRRISPKAAINLLATPSHQCALVNRAAD